MVTTMLVKRNYEMFDSLSMSLSQSSVIACVVPRTKEIHARDNSNCPDDTELCECDLSDRELKHYLRTEEEIKALSSLSATSQENKET
jgi:hypothetical protein